MEDDSEMMEQMHIYSSARGGERYRIRALSPIIPTMGKRYPPKSPAAEAITLALAATLLMATSAPSTGIIILGEAVVRAKAGVVTAVYRVACINQSINQSVNQSRDFIDVGRGAV